LYPKEFCSVISCHSPWLGETVQLEIRSCVRIAQCGLFCSSSCKNNLYDSFIIGSIHIGTGGRETPGSSRLKKRGASCRHHRNITAISPANVRNVRKKHWISATEPNWSKWPSLTTTAQKSSTRTRTNPRSRCRHFGRGGDWHF